MAYYFYNTDAKSLTKPGRFPVLIRKNVAVTSGPLKFGDLLSKLAPGDTLLMYENGVGVVAVGEVREAWDGKAYEHDPWYYRIDDRGPDGRGFGQEYRIKVGWTLDLSDDPVSPSRLKARIGYAPRGTLAPVRKREDAVARLVQDLRVRERR